MDKNWQTKEIEELITGILRLRNQAEALSFFGDLMSAGELKTLANRFTVAQMLEQGIPYVDIEKSTGMSSATISKISRALKYGHDGYHTIITRLKRRR